MEKRTIKCKHIKKNMKTVYIYDIDDEQDVMLCSCCNMNLAGEMMKQLAIRTFCPDIDDL